MATTAKERGQMANDASDRLDEAREQYDAFRETMVKLRNLITSLDPKTERRVDAYTRWFARDLDLGAGQTMEQWFDEIEDAIYEKAKRSHRR